LVEERSFWILSCEHRHRKMQEANEDGQITPADENYNGALIHHQSILRNKRCLLAYMYELLYTQFVVSETFRSAKLKDSMFL
jgi:hypothetical protein